MSAALDSHEGRRPDDSAQSTRRSLDDGKTVKYLDTGDKFLEADGTLPKSIMPDALHPNAKGYEIWAEAIAPTVHAML